MRGCIKYYNSEKGFGFILPEDGDDIFFHVSSVRSLKTLTPGMVVEFETEMGNKGLKARDVRVLNDASTHRPKFFSFGNESIKMSNIRSFALREDRLAIRVDGKAKQDSPGFLFFDPSTTEVEYHNLVVFPWRVDVSEFGFSQKDAERFEAIEEMIVINKSGRTVFDYTKDRFNISKYGLYPDNNKLTALRRFGMRAEWFIMPILEVLTFRGNNFSFFDLNDPEEAKRAYQWLREYMS